MNTKNFAEKYGLTLRQVKYLVDIGLISKPIGQGKGREYDEIDFWIMDLISLAKKYNIRLENLSGVVEFVRKEPQVKDDGFLYIEPIPPLVLGWDVVRGRWLIHDDIGGFLNALVSKGIDLQEYSMYIKGAEFKEVKNNERHTKTNT